MPELRGRGRAAGSAGVVVDRALRLDADRAHQQLVQLGALAGKRFDAVFDNNTSKPHFVQQTTELLRDSGRYMFTSSTGVYYPYLKRGVDESTPVRLEATDTEWTWGDGQSFRADSGSLVALVSGSRPE